jgi:hypothetical protein
MTYKLKQIIMKNSIKTIIAIFIVSVIGISCSKDDDKPQAPVYQTEDFLGGFLANANYSSRVAALDEILIAEYGLVFKPNVKGEVSALVMNSPKAGVTMRVTLWDKATKAIIKQSNISIVTVNTKTYAQINPPIQLTKDKEYVISFKATNRWFHEKTTNVAYPIVSGNITVLNAVTSSLVVAGDFPINDSDKNRFSGDCSFVFKRTE